MTRTSVSDEWRASWLSQATFWWLTPLIRLGAGRPLRMDDLGDLVDGDGSKRTLLLLEKELAEDRSRSLWWVFWSAFGGLFLPSGICKLVGDLLGFVGPFALAAIVESVEEGGATTFGGIALAYWWAIAMVVAAAVQNTLLQQHHHLVIRAGMHARTATTALVFRKTLRLSTRGRSELGRGVVMNVQSQDARRIELAYWLFHYSWAAPLQVIIAVVLLYMQIGPYCFAGVAVIALVAPLQRKAKQVVEYLSTALSAFTDERVSHITELVFGIRTVKLLAWEDTLRERVEKARNEELVHVRQLAALNGSNESLGEAGPVLAALVTFVAYGLVEPTPLSPAPAFASLALFNILRLPFFITPMLVDALGGAAAGLRRLRSVLEADEVVTHVRAEAPPPLPARDGGASADAPAAVEFVDFSGSWHCPPPAEGADTDGEGDTGSGPEGGEDGEPTPASGIPQTASGSPATLRGVTLALPEGSLTTVVGKVGSGKSSLLAAVLNELPRDGGEIVLRLRPVPGATTHTGGVAYCPQHPWLLGATIRDNILFGEELDEERLRRVIQACQLEEDLRIMPAGQLTEIGPRGHTLSGGQCARVGLARAAYSHAPLVLLDDVLSAVDAHVGRRLFDQVIRGILRDRTVILVSHQLQFVPKSDYAVVMHRGTVQEWGRTADLLAPGAEPTALRAMLDAASAAIEEAAPSAPPAAAAASAAAAAAAAAADAPVDGAEEDHAPEGHSREEHAAGDAGDIVVEVSAGPERTAVAAGAKEDAADSAAEADGTVVEEEERQVGAVRWAVYSKYVLAMGIWFFAGLMLVQLVSTGLTIATSWWLSRWSSNTFGESTSYYVNVYAVLAASAVVSVLLYQVLWAAAAAVASKVLHNGLLRSIVRAPTLWFDRTPSGRITSRFGADMQVIDQMLPRTLSRFLHLLLVITAMLGLQVAVLPWVLVAFVPIIALYITVQQVYRRTSRELKRLDNITRSPVFNHLEETQDGLQVVRAFGYQRQFMDKQLQFIDDNSRAFWKLNLSNRWLGLRLDIVGALLVGTTAIASAASIGVVDAGLIAFAIAAGQTLVDQLNWAVRSATEAETYMASVERVLEFAEDIPQEASAEDPADAPPVPADWPSRGAVEIDDLSMQYLKKHGLVLKHVSASIGGGERIGVCGRTGSGKSSLMNCLFRVVEPATGTIRIDGIDICRIGLKTLRSRLAIIPQEAVVFAGSVRFNLDCTLRATDAAMFDALRRAGLEERIRELGGLDTTDVGGKLSAGERQLLCIARALLRNARVLALDEATASIDHATDTAVQAMMRSEFEGCTILTIAHRLHTIADSDRILVLQQGELLELDSPAALLANPSSEYARLTREAAAGHAM